MKIITVVDSIPPICGGSQNVAWDLSLAFSSRGHEVHIITFGEKTDYFTRDGLFVHRIKEPKRTHLYFLGKGYYKIINIVKEINPDIIHSHSPTILAYSLRKIQIRKVLTMHNSKYEDYNFSLYMKLKNRFFINNTVKNYDYVTVPSKHMQRYFNTYFNRNFGVIPNGVDLAKFNSNGMKRNLKNIIYVGRLINEKSVDELFKLAKLLPNYNFTFVGNGPLYKKIDLPNVLFMGLQKSDKLSNIYNNSAFSIFPGSTENFPLVGLESMACGTVVVSNKNGFSEYIDNGVNGFLLQDSSCEGLYDFFKNNNSIINFDQIQRNGIVTSNEYSWDKISDKYLELFNRIK